MADSILTLKVDDREYTASLRDAKKGMLALEQAMRDSSKSFNDADKQVIDYAKGIGQMTTQSQTAKGQVSEMTQAFTELSIQYERLTDEEKSSPFGQAMSQSLEQLRERVIDGKAQLDQVNQSLQGTSNEGKETGGVMSQLASKFTINIDAIKLLNIGLQATKAALDVAKDAFFASESNVDEWGRTVESGRSIYESFVQTLNSGNFSTFFSNLDNVVAKARAAYDAIDNLNTMMTIINPERAKLQAQQTELKAEIRRSGADSETGKKAQQELKALEPKLQQSYKDEAKMNMDAFTALVDQRLAEAQINLDKNSRNFLLRSFYDTDTYERLKANARGGMETVSTGQMTMSTGGVVDLTRTKDTRNINQRLLDLFTDAWRKENSGYLSGSFNARNQAASMMLGNARYLRETTGGTSGGGRSTGGTTTTGTTTGRTNIQVEKSEMQLNNERIKQLTEEYVKLSNQREEVVAKETATIKERNIESANISVSDNDTNRDIQNQLNKTVEESATEIASNTTAITNIDARRDAIREEIKSLQERNTEIKKISDEAIGIVVPDGSFKDLNEQLHELQKERELLTDPIDVAVTDEQIQRVKDSIDELNGKKADIKIQQTPTIEYQIKTKIADQNTAIDTATFTNLLEFKLKNDIQDIDIPTEYLTEAIFRERLDIPDDYWQNLVDDINTKLEELGIEPITLDVKTGNITQMGKQVQNDWQQAAQAVQSVGSALAGLEDPGVKIAGIVGQAIANIALGFAQATASDSKLGVWGWIAAVAGGLGTMISTISAIKSATSGNYAEGGIVPGSDFSGDNRTINVNSGELILNRAQQSNIAGALTTTSGDLQLEAILDGEKIRLAVDRANRRRGRGEYAYSKKG